MKVNGQPYRTIWRHPDKPAAVQIIDQRWLPFRFEVEDLETVDEVATAIRDMHVRGAGCIGATAGFGLAIATANPQESLDASAKKLLETRPTAVNLRWAIDRQLAAIKKAESPEDRTRIAWQTAQAIADEDAQACAQIGRHGLPLIESLAANKPNGKAVNVLTHCNAGWLAFVDHGSATAPLYAAHDAGIPIHVWVDETRPRNQGARLTAWELGQHGVPHTLIVDNAGGHLMQRGDVDLVITGTDRTTHTGDVANKIGTYLKALAARDNGIPFYVALPSSTFDWQTADGMAIPIEERSEQEVTQISGIGESGEVEQTVSLTPTATPAGNPAFDVTPARLVTGLITERGVCEANKEAISALFSDMATKR